MVMSALVRKIFIELTHDHPVFRNVVQDSADPKGQHLKLNDVIALSQCFSDSATQIMF